ncbi:MAG: phosphotransferase family protein [Anaerolineae bacterium]
MKDKRMTPEQQTLLAQLQAYLSEQMMMSVTITDARPLAGGASRDTWWFVIEADDASEQLVMRRDLPTQMFEQALTREQEFHLMRTAYEQGVTVARVRWLCADPDVLGSPFFIMDYVSGTSIGRRVIGRDEFATARAVLPGQMARELACIHQMDVSAPELAFLKYPAEGRTPAQQAIHEMRLVLDDLGADNPVWEWALRWVQTHLPPPNPLTFVHGDFRIGNLLVDEQTGLTAVIDWEFGHVGNPDEELGYLCMRDWRFGAPQHRAGGLTDRESFLKVYESASGRTVQRESVDWWEIMGNIRWGIICMAQANRHLSGQEVSVELASLGRRSAEMQLETLRLIEATGLFD